MSERVEVLELDLTNVQKEAQDTGKTLKDLRGEVKELRQTLENTEIGTEKFGQTLSELTVKQQELTNVTKSGVAAQKGSYNELVNQMAILKKQWRSTSDEVERAALGDQILEINNKLKELDSTIGNHQREVGNYRQVLKGLKEELLTLEEGTAEYNEKLAQAAEISQKMQDVNEFVSASAADLGDHMQNLVGAASGISGAFQTVQASLNLMGVESEGVTKMIATMQNVMAITSGLQAIEGSIDAFKRLSIAVKSSTLFQKLFTKSRVEDIATTKASTAAHGANTAAVKAGTMALKGLKTALITTGIGALVVGLGHLVDKLSSTEEETEDVNKELQEFVSIMDELDKRFRRSAMFAEISTINKYAEAVREAGSDIEKLRQARRDFEDQSDIDKRSNLFDRESAVYEKRLEVLQKINLLLNANIDLTETSMEDAYRLLSEKFLEGDALGKFSTTLRQALINFSKNYVELTEENNNIQLQKAQIQLDDTNALVDAMLEGEERRVERQEKLLEEHKEQLRETIKTDSNFATERAKILKELDQLQFDATQSPEEDPHKVEIATLERELEAKKLIYKNYYETVRKDEKDNIIARLITEEEYNQALEDLTTIYTEKIGKVRIEQAKAADAEILAERAELQKRIDEISQDAMKSLAGVYRKMDIASEQSNRTQNFVELAKQTQIILGAEREALIAQQDSLNTLKNELIKESKDVTLVNEALAENADALTLNAEMMKTALADQKASQLESVADTIAGVQESLDTIMSLEMGSQLGEEFSIAFTAIQEGLGQTSELLKTGSKEWTVYGKMAASGLNAAANILSSIANKQSDETEEGFEKQKKLQIAAATMAMFGGVVNAITSAFNPANAWMTIYGQSAAASAMSALVLTSGLMQINQIKKQKFDGESTASSSPTLSALQMVDTGVQATTNIDGASVEGTVTDTRVYVVESDITSTQHNIKTTVSEATF